jgi:hypothetical protein
MRSKRGEQLTLSSRVSALVSLPPRLRVELTINAKNLFLETQTTGNPAW